MSDIRADQEILSPFCRGAIHELQGLEQSGHQNMKCGHQRGFTVQSAHCTGSTEGLPLRLAPRAPASLRLNPEGQWGWRGAQRPCGCSVPKLPKPPAWPEARVRSRPAPCLQPLIGTSWATQALLSGPWVPCCCQDHCLEPAALPHPPIPTPPCPLHGAPPILRTGPITSDYY